MEIGKSLIVLFVSIFAGFIGGQVGGGGLIIVPMFLFIGLNPLAALGSDRITAVFMDVGGSVGYFKKHKLDLKHYFGLGLAALIGSIIGTLILFSLPLDQLLLKKILIVVLFIVAAFMIFRKDLGLTDNKFVFSKKQYLLIFLTILLVSIYGGMFSVAVTTFLAMVFLHNEQSFSQSMGHALFLSTIISGVSLLIFLFNNSIDITYGIISGAGGLIGALIGSHFAIRKGNFWIKKLVLVIVLAVLIKLFFEIF